MADLILNVPTGEISLVAATAKTVLTAKAPANQRLKLKGLEIFGKGISPTDVPIKVELNIITTDGGTATTITPSDNDNEMGETAQGVYKSNYSVEPTTYGASIRVWEVHPQTGLIVYFPMHDELKLKGGTEFGIRMTAAAAQTVSINAIVEE
jgi:hypothetical protein